MPFLPTNKKQSIIFILQKIEFWGRKKGKCIWECRRCLLQVFTPSLKLSEHWTLVFPLSPSSGTKGHQQNKSNQGWTSKVSKASPSQRLGFQSPFSHGFARRAQHRANELQKCPTEGLPSHPGKKSNPTAHPQFLFSWSHGHLFLR